MARGVNKVILIGNLGKDPETRYSAGNMAITNITVATTDSRKDKDTGQWQEQTEWHRVVFFGKVAETAGQYLKKGAKVYIEGSIRTRSYEKDGQKHYITEIVGNDMQMLDSRGAGGGSGASAGGGEAFDHGFDQPAPARSGRPAPSPAPASSAPARANDFDDDIPF